MINCRKCVFFYITWDKKFPYGCRGLSFRSNRLPSYDVFNSSGMECLKFTPKPEDKKPPANKGFTKLG